MENKNVVVVGASAVGSLAAKYLAEKGLSVQLLEEDARPGKFGKCGGIFSKEGMEQTGVSYRNILLNEVKGARILSRKKEMRVKAPSVKGVLHEVKFWISFISTRTYRAYFILPNIYFKAKLFYLT